MLTLTTSTVTLQHCELNAALSSVSPACCNEATRYYLCGVYVHAEMRGNGESVLHFVATDGHRLHRSTVKVDAATVANFVPVILPVDFVQSLIKATSKRSYATRLCTLQISRD